MERAGNRVEIFRYDPITEPQARGRAEVLVHRVGLGSDEGLQPRLAAELGAWLDPSRASELAAHIKELYVLLACPKGAADGDRVDPGMLERAVVLAWTRPAEDPCWLDYVGVATAVHQRWQAVRDENRLAPMRRLRRLLTGTTPDRIAEEAAWARPITAARKQFSATWCRTTL